MEYFKHRTVSSAIRTVKAILNELEGYQISKACVKPKDMNYSYIDNIAVMKLKHTYSKFIFLIISVTIDY